RSADDDRREGVEPAGLPAAPDLAPRLRLARVLGAVAERPRPARGVHARAPARRRAARGAVRIRYLARVDCAADHVRRPAVLLGAGGPDAGTAHGAPALA